MKEIYGDDLAIVFKHFPLSFHKQAMPAAKASLAASDQGKFWEYHDKIFENQKGLKKATDETFVGFAEELGLDVEKFKASFKDPKWDAEVRKDMGEARVAGVRGTPSLFINGRKYEGNMSPLGFKSVIDKEILGK